MKINMGPGDRVIRIAIATIIAVLCFQKTITGTWALVLGIIAGVFLITSFIGNCPLYSIFGINTCKKNPKDGTARN